MATIPSIPLFQTFPALARELPYVSLGLFPTPVQRLDGLCRRLGRDGLFIKRDDLSGEPYGGNKVRKLEFLLGQARAQKAGTVITMGAAGSNHALATAVYARKLGLKSVLLLMPQPVSRPVRENLLMDLHIGAQLRYFESAGALKDAIPAVIADIRRRDGAEPLFIPTGGTTSLGATGFVNAGLELAAQVRAGLIPEPDAVYVAFGSMGTAAGLAVGLRLAECKTRVIGVRVVPSSVGNEEGLRRLMADTSALLHSHDPAVPTVDPDSPGVEVRHDHFGGEYGLITPEAEAAMRLIDECDGISLDGTYTAKAFAAFLDAARAQPNATFLFWDTKNSRPLPPAALAGDYRRLPADLHRYFEQPLAELDRR